jgi:ribokinase
MPPRIRVIGSLNIDYTTTTPRFPGAGETITARALSINAGGKGANQAVACGRASYTSKTMHDVQVEMVGAVGAKDPQYTALLKPVLERTGIDCSGVREVEGSQTGTATIIVDEASGGENRILVVPGANYDGMEDTKEVLKRALKEPLPEVFVLQGEIPQETTFALLKAIPEAAGKGGKMVEVVFNPAPVYREGIPVDCLKYVTHLIVNETEMGQLAVDAGDRYNAADTEEEKRAALNVAATTFHRRLIRNVVITRGADGVFCSTPDGSFHLDAAKVTKVSDTTAAGDTFVGYYAVELARQKERTKEMATEETLNEACRRATLAASRCVERRGAVESIPWGHEIGEQGKKLSKEHNV